MTARGIENSKYQGSKWIRREKRLAIYLRDGMACVWCRAAVEEGVQLSLDHLVPFSQGGSNDEANLVTCCKICNSSRGTRTVDEFARAVAEYKNHGLTGYQICTNITRLRWIALDIPAAKSMIKARGSWNAIFNQEG